MTYKMLARRGRLAAIAVGLTVLVASTGTSAASAYDRKPGRGAGSGTECSAAERRSSLALEQRRVLKLVKDFRVLRNQADLDRLAQPREGVQFFVLSHRFNSIRGMGFTIVNGGQVTGPGKPAMLLYKPSHKAKNVTDPDGPDFPYELVGWGYAGPYTPGQPPAFPDDPGLRCVRPTDWFVHERSVHPADTWQNIPVPPVEDYPGQDPGSLPPLPDECDPPCVGEPHPRIWDLHVWFGANGVPTLSMLNPGKPIPGFDPEVGVGFFYPQLSGCAAPARTAGDSGLHLHHGAHGRPVTAG